jgi:hypothetical protein
MDQSNTSSTSSGAVSTALIAALIQQVALPELVSWLKGRNGQPITDADIIAKLGVDIDTGIATGEAFLAEP